MKARRWNPYAEEHDLVLDSMEEVDQVDEALRALSTVVDGMPGWLVEETGLDKALDLLRNATMDVEA